MSFTDWRISHGLLYRAYKDNEYSGGGWGGEKYDIKSNQDLFKRDIEFLNKKLGRVACMYGFHHM